MGARSWKVMILVCCAGAPSTVFQGGCAVPPASGTFRASGSTATVSGLFFPLRLCLSSALSPKNMGKMCLSDFLCVVENEYSGALNENSPWFGSTIYGSKETEISIKLEFAIVNFVDCSGASGISVF